MDFLFGLLNNPYVPWIIGIVVILVGYQQLSTRLRMRLPGSSLSLDGLAGKLLGQRYTDAQLEKAIKREKKFGNFLAMGKMYEDAGKLQQSVDAYLEGSEFYAAAGVLERMGKAERAAELYLQAGDYKKAAQLFVENNKPGRAATLFLEKGNTLEAARLFALAQEWSKAADLYAKAGYPLRAAEAFEKQGEWLKAAECHEKHFMENVSFSTTYSSTAPSADQRAALHAGRLYEKAGDLNKALSIYVKGQYFKEAGAASGKLGQHAKAAEWFMRAEDPQSAANAFEQAGDKVKAANLRGEVALKQEKVPDAARAFQDGQDYLRAAELYESVGMLAEAAGAYEAGDSYAAAGSVYIRAGLKDRAAASYERAGDLETAAKLYEEAGSAHKAMELYDKAGLTFKSGEAAANAGEREKAIGLLQRVPPTDDNYRAATEVLARLFIESRMPGLAIERLQKVLAGQPVSAATLDLNYWLAMAHEASGAPQEALSLYKKVLAEDLQFKDVDKRVARLQSGAPAAAAPTPRPVTPRPMAPPPAAPQPRAGSALTSAPTAAPAPPTAPAPAAPRTPAPAAAPAGAKPPRFLPKEELGRGPLGAVFRAEDQVDGRSVALRFLASELLAGDGVLHGLVGDLKAAAQLSHPNVVKVLGLVEVSGQRCVVTEHVPGRNFSEALKMGHKMSFQQIHGLGRVLAQALSLIHGKGQVHGSVQPSNVMVASGVVKLADLGLVRLARKVPRSPDYNSPEGTLDVAADLFAMAAVLYHLLTGVHPRSQPQGSALPLPSTLATGVPEAFDKLLLRCLHPRIELRHRSAEDVLRELKDMVKIG